MTPEHMKTTPEDIDLDRMKDDTISRQAVLKLLSTIPAEEAITKAMLIQSVKQMDAAQPSGPDNLVKDSQGLAKDLVNDCISRKAAIEAIKEDKIDLTNPNVVAVFKATGDFEKVETQVMTCDRHIEILKDLPYAQPEQRWIPCSERLPEDEQPILFSTTTGRVHQGRFHRDNSVNRWYSSLDKMRAYNNVVNAWMPLPEPAKLGGD